MFHMFHICMLLMFHILPMDLLCICHIWLCPPAVCASCVSCVHAADWSSCLAACGCFIIFLSACFWFVHMSSVWLLLCFHMFPACLLLVFPHVHVCLLLILSFLTCLDAPNLFICFLSACCSLFSYVYCLIVFEMSHMSFVHAVACSYISCLADVGVSCFACLPAVDVFIPLLSLYHCLC